MPHAWPAGLLEEQKQSIRDALAKHKLTISNINAFMMNADRRSAAAVLASELDRARSALPRDPPRAHEAGAAAWPTTSARRTSRPSPAARSPPANPGQAGAAIFYEELMPCIEVAEKLGVPLLIEPEPGLLIERFDQYLEFVDRIDSPMIGLNFDIGHAYCVGEDPQDWVAKMAAAHAALSPRRHRRHARPPAPRPRPRRDRLRRHARRDSAKPATTAGSPSSSIRTSTIPTPPPAKRSSFSRRNLTSRLLMNDSCNISLCYLCFLLFKNQIEQEITEETEEMNCKRRNACSPGCNCLRLPNVFTAVADVTMGYLVTHGDLQPARALRVARPPHRACSI